MKSFMHKTFFKKTAIASMVAVFTLMSGCTSDDPDKGSSSDRNSLSGTAVDGYLAGATVYLDYNENGRRNSGEAYAVTDKDGYFSTSKDGLTDYCSSGATTQEKRHCLSAIETGFEVVLRTYGGFDVYTGEPFLGTMSARIDADAFSSSGVLTDQIISPITSLLAELSEEDRSAFETAYDLDLEADENRDFLSTTGFDADTANAAIAFHKVVTIYSDILDDYYEEIGSDNQSFPLSSSVFIYEAIADLVRSGGGTKLTSANVGGVFDAAETLIRDLYDEVDDEDKGNPISVAESAAVTAAKTNVASVLDLIETALVTTGDDEITADNVQARIIAVEMVVKKVLDEEESTEIDAAITIAEDLSSDLYTELGDGEDIDFSGLVDITYVGTPDFSEITITGAEDLSVISGKQLYINYDEVGEDKSGSAFFFFNAASADSDSGSLEACLRYDDGDDEEVSSDESDGALFDGSWFVLDDSRLIITFEGSIDVALISKGDVIDDGETKKKYSLSYGGDTVSWLSDDGLLEDGDTDFIDMPSSSSGCETLLEELDTEDVVEEV